MTNEFTIVGCGRLGSFISLNIVYYISDYLRDKKYIIYLVDYDILRESNLPYLWYSNDSLIGLYKVQVLTNILSDINNNNIKYIPITNDYMSEPDLDNNYLIDCRDTIDCDSRFKIKVTFDGHYGTYIINPKTEYYNESRSDYQVKASNFYANVIASMICRKYIFSDINHNEIIYGYLDYHKNKHIITCDNNRKIIKIGDI